MANKQRDADKERFWRDVLKRRTGSGLSVRVFCRREGLAESAFYFWRREIAERDVSAHRPVGAKVAESAKRPHFLPVRVSGNDGQRGAFAIELAGGRVLRLPETILPERLADFVQALEARGPR